MKSTRVVIVGNGLLDKEFLKEITPEDYCIGVDYAAYWLVRNGRIPEVAIGDFDSVTAEQFKEIKKRIPDIIRFTPEKDFTDMELAVRHAIRRKPHEIVLLGVLGKRLDHAIANISLLEMIEESGTCGYIKDATNKVTVVSKNMTVTDEKGYISVLPITGQADVTLVGFKYSVRGKVIRRGQTIGVSNERTGKTGSITVNKGKVLVVVSHE